MREDLLDISVIIVSYNTRQMTMDCLKALYTELGQGSAEVLLVDNASADGTAEAVRAAFPQVKLMANEKNVGFGAGNNLAMRQARGRYFLLLNTDAFLRPGAVEAMVQYLEKHAEAALVGPRLLNQDGSLQRSCYRFPSPIRAWAENLWIPLAFKGDHHWGDYRRWGHDREQFVDWVIGACCLVRREAYEQIGGFDEQFFMYAEETDWQRRMRKAGWQIGFTPAAEVVHLGGASGAAEKPKINRHFFSSLDRYEYKHHGIFGLVAVRAAMSVGCLLRLVLWMAVLICIPARRAVAAAKVKMMGWLLWRQATCWHFSAA